MEMRWRWSISWEEDDFESVSGQPPLIFPV
jgi:hypothetical protein